MTEDLRDPIETLLIEMKEGIDKISAAFPKISPTDYRGQFKLMADEVSRLSISVLEFQKFLGGFPRPITNSELDSAMAKIVDQSESRLNSLAKTMDRSARYLGLHRAVWATTAFLLIFAGGWLGGVITADPVRSYVSSSFKSITQSNCESLGGHLNTNQDGDQYCAKFFDEEK